VGTSSRKLIRLTNPHQRRLLDIQLKLKTLSCDDRCHSVMVKEKDSNILKPLYMCRKPNKCLACRAYYTNHINKKMWQLLSSESKSKFDHIIISPSKDYSDQESVSKLKKLIALVNKSKNKNYKDVKIIWAIHPAKDNLPSHAHAVIISNNVVQLAKLEDKLREKSYSIFLDGAYVKRAKSRVIAKHKSAAKTDDLVRLALYCVSQAVGNNFYQGWTISGFSEGLDVKSVAYPNLGPSSKWEAAYRLQRGRWVRYSFESKTLVRS